MHELHIDVKVKGAVTEEQLAKMAFTLYTQVNNYLRHLPVKSSPIVWHDDLLVQSIPSGGEN